MGIGPIWVHLPGLPLQFWAEDIFRCIGDDMGVYLDHNRSYQDTGCMEIARILVHLDTKEGLVESNFLQMDEITRWQILNYEGIPFHCRRCHEVGNLYKDCSLLSGKQPDPSWSLVSTSTQTMEVEIPSSIVLPGILQLSGDVTRVAPSRLDSGTSVALTTRSCSRESVLFSGTLPPSPLFSHDCMFTGNAFASILILGLDSGVNNLCSINCPMVTTCPHST